jgi:ribulose bisphosphate carboxylase small subunit
MNFFAKSLALKALGRTSSLDDLTDTQKVKQIRLLVEEIYKENEEIKEQTVQMMERAS